MQSLDAGIALCLRSISTVREVHKAVRDEELTSAKRILYYARLTVVVSLALLLPRRV